MTEALRSEPEEQSGEFPQSGVIFDLEIYKSQKLIDAHYASEQDPPEGLIFPEVRYRLQDHGNTDQDNNPYNDIVIYDHREDSSSNSA